MAPHLMEGNYVHALTPETPWDLASALSLTIPLTNPCSPVVSLQLLPQDLSMCYSLCLGRLTLG